jgi:hypothetical protein
MPLLEYAPTSRRRMGMPSGELTKTAADATSITYQATDPDGIYMIQTLYATPDMRHTRHFRTAVARCPATLTITLDRQHRVAGRTLTLTEVTVIDCSHLSSGSHGGTRFGIDGGGNAERIGDSEIPIFTQQLLEAMGEAQKALDEAARRQRRLLALLLILMLLALWAALGPLFL